MVQSRVLNATVQVKRFELLIQKPWPTSSPRCRAHLIEDFYKFLCIVFIILELVRSCNDIGRCSKSILRIALIVTGESTSASNPVLRPSGSGVTCHQVQRPLHNLRDSPCTAPRKDFANSCEGVAMSMAGPAELCATTLNTRDKQNSSSVRQTNKHRPKQSPLQPWTPPH